MSYCRFENTSKDMNDCLLALDRGETNNLSDSELEGLENFLQYAKHIIELEREIKDTIEDQKIKNKQYSDPRYSI